MVLKSVSNNRDMPGSSSIKQALGLDGIGEDDEPLISLKSTTTRSRIEYARGLDAEENNDVQVVAALTQEGRIQRNFQEAERKGDVIVMLDSDGEDNATPHQKKAATKKPSSPERSHASSTKQALGLDGIGDEPLISLKTTKKRPRLQYARGLDAETTKRRPDDSTYAIHNSLLAILSGSRGTLKKNGFNVISKKQKGRATSLLCWIRTARIMQRQNKLWVLMA
jgi:hypothetical protein